jgi:imidazolonepropionase-like amidohydrolase
MRLEPAFDAFYVLGSLWGGLTGPQVCTSSPDVLLRTPHETVRAPVRALAGVTAFLDVAVVPMDTERVLQNQTVLVEGGRITALGPSAKVKVPAGAVRIDGRGKYLMPGLADMHPHGRLSEDFLQTREGDKGLSRLARGITTVRQIVGGELDPQQLRRHFETAEVPGPRLYISPKIPGTDGPIPPSLRVDSVAAYIATAKAAGYHHLGLKLSVKGLVERDARTLAFFDSLVAGARRAGLPLADHTHRLSFEAVLALGSTGGSVEHLSGVFWDSLGFWDPPRRHTTTDVPMETIRPMAAALQRAGVWVTPTLRCLQKHSQSPHWVKILDQLVKTLHEAGVGMFLAEDDGFDVHDELAALVRAGLSPYQALLTGTHNPAQYLGLLDSSGTVAVGKWADLVLLAGNPLADVRHAREPAGVMIAGRWLDQALVERHRAAPPGVRSDQP